MVVTQAFAMCDHLIGAEYIERHFRIAERMHQLLTIYYPKIKTILDIKLYLGISRYYLSREGLIPT